MLLVLNTTCSELRARFAARILTRPAPKQAQHVLLAKTTGRTRLEELIAKAFALLQHHSVGPFVINVFIIHLFGASSCALVGISPSPHFPVPCTIPYRARPDPKLWVAAHGPVWTVSDGCSAEGNSARQERSAQRNVDAKTSTAIQVSHGGETVQRLAWRAKIACI